MKWGVHRSAKKSAQNERLAKKAYKYDARSAKLTKKSEKRHTKYDIGAANRAAVKSAKYTKKAANLNRKSLSADSENRVLHLQQKAAKLNYKSKKQKIKANRISKTTGYGEKAMRYSIKSDKVAKKAAKARSIIASNKSYINMMNRKLSTLDPEKLRKVEQPFTETMRESMASAVSSVRNKIN